MAILVNNRFFTSQLFQLVKFGSLIFYQLYVQSKKICPDTPISHQDQPPSAVNLILPKVFPFFLISSSGPIDTLDVIACFYINRNFLFHVDTGHDHFIKLKNYVLYIPNTEWFLISEKLICAKVLVNIKQTSYNCNLQSQLEHTKEKYTLLN